MRNDLKLTTEQTAAELGVSVQRVKALIKAGRLKATKFGRSHEIKYSDLASVRVRKPGRPRKAKNPAT